MSFLNSLFGTKKAKTADFEKLAVQFDQAQGKYLKLLIDGLSASEVGERRAWAKVIADTVVPALVDNTNCPFQPAAKASLLKMLNVLMAELRPPKNEDEKWALNQAAFFTVKRLLKIEDDKQRNAQKAEETRQTRFEAKGFGVTDSPALDKAKAELEVAMFPNGPTDAARDVARVLSLFHNKLSTKECLECVRGTKALLLMSKDKSAERIVPSIMVRAGNKITEAEAYSAYAYLSGEATRLDQMHKILSTVTTGKNVTPEARKVYEDLLKGVSKLNRNEIEAAVDADELPNGYGAYGTTITNPVLTISVGGSTDYLNRLRFNGRAITYHRSGYQSSNVTPGMTDIYQIACDGESLGAIYISPYHKRNSQKAPQGFTFFAGSLGANPATPPATTVGAVPSGEASGARFCSRCGFPTKATASFCTNCGCAINFPVRPTQQKETAPAQPTKSQPEGPVPQRPYPVAKGDVARPTDQRVVAPKHPIAKTPPWNRQFGDDSLGTRVQAPPSDASKGMSSHQPTADPRTPVAIPAAPNQNTIEAHEDQLYEQIAQELETNTLDKGLWTKAYAQAGGDDQQTRVLYIKARFSRLLAMENTQRDAIRRTQEQEQETVQRDATRREQEQEQDEVARLARAHSIQANLQSRIEEIETAGKSVELKSLAAGHTGDHFLYLCGLGKWFVDYAQRALEENPFVLDRTTLDEGYTGLHIAVRSKDKKMIECLVEQGANIQARDSQGKTPLDMARETNQPEVVTLLERFRAEG
mgnify:CR=1 FL=1